jgi:hypothetical protein
MEFIARFGKKVTGMLRGFDRMLFRGTLRRIVTAEGLGSYLNQAGILLRDFGTWAQAQTALVRKGTEENELWRGRPNLYLQSAKERKEELAREIAARDKIKQGPICILRAVEPCYSFEIVRNRALQKLVLERRFRKGLAVYLYQMHPEFGFMHTRFQTWLPFDVQVCINGREWLGRMLDRAGVGYVRRDNCFTELGELSKAQALAESQAAQNWPNLLSKLLKEGNQTFDQLFPKPELWYYWSLKQSEWATDIMFQQPEDLAAIYPQLITHGLRVFNSPDVMRFLGHRTPAHGGVHGGFNGEVISTLKRRPEGVRIKHSLNANSIKMYDKQGSVLRVETTINQPQEFKVYRRPEGAAPKTKPDWLPMRCGVADIKRRARVSDAANNAYIAALPQPSNATKLKSVFTPVTKQIKHLKSKARPIQPFSDHDRCLLAAVAQGDFAINGFRNRDLRTLLYPGLPSDPVIQLKHSRAVTRKLRLLRAHGLIKKVPHTHRYRLTATGSQLINTLAAVTELTTEQLFKLAA